MNRNTLARKTLEATVLHLSALGIRPLINHFFDVDGETRRILPRTMLVATQNGTRSVMWFDGHGGSSTLFEEVTRP